MFYDDWIIDLLFLQVLVIHASIDYIIQYSFTSIYNLPDTVILGGRRGSLPSSNGINKAQLSFILIIGGETYDNQGITVHTTRWIEGSRFFNSFNIISNCNSPTEWIIDSPVF